MNINPREPRKEEAFADYEPCGNPDHPQGVDDLDYHLRGMDNLPTPDGLFECWLHPLLPDGTSVRHPDRRRWFDHYILMLHARSEAASNIEARWNDLTTRQRQAFIDSFAEKVTIDPAHLSDFDPKTLKLPARKPNNPPLI